jgi:hypothetical protein
MPDNEKDPHAWGRPDEAWLAQLSASAPPAPPKPEDWNQLVIELLWVLELERRAWGKFKSGSENAPPPPLIAVDRMVRLITMFMQQYLGQHVDLIPLSRLISAFYDLLQGRRPSLLEPRDPPPHSPGKGQLESVLKGYAAACVELQVQAGRSPPEAAQRVASELNSGLDHWLITARNILTTRNNVRRGAASEEAIQAFNSVPADYGNTPWERAERLLRQLRGRGREISQ